LERIRLNDDGVPRKLIGVEASRRFSTPCQENSPAIPAS
jgi:hypothetical protein